MTFCILPWVQVSIRPDGSVRPCSWCTDVYRMENNNKYRIYEHHIDEILTSKSAKEFKKNIINGQWNNSCIRCKEAEKSGIKSRRQQELQNKKYQEIKEQVLKGNNVDSYPLFVDFRPSNYCNIACITCDHISSSKIYSQIKKHPVLKNYYYWNRPSGVTTTKLTPMYFENLNQLLSKSEVVYLTGGEPTIIAENWKILENLIKSRKTNVEVRMSINLTYITQKQIEILNCFKSLQLYFSIDSVGREIEYIRYPSKWTTIEKNLEHVMTNIRKNQADCLYITPTVSIFNIFSLGKILDWYSLLEYSNLGIRFYALLHDPRHFSIKHLPVHLKQKASEYLTSLINKYPKHKEQLSRPLMYLNLNGDPNIFFEAKRYIDLIDSTRNIKFSEVFPDMYKEMEGKIHD